MSTLMGPFLAIAGAVITGLFSYFNIILAKEQKLSEFRQNWIDGLREDLSEYGAACDSMVYMIRSYEYERKEKVDYVEIAIAIQEANTNASVKFNRVMLRLNPHNKDLSQQALVGQLEKIRQEFKDRAYDEVVQQFPELREKAAWY